MLCWSEIMVQITDSFQKVLTVADPEFSEAWLGCFKQLIATLDSMSPEVASLLNTTSSGLFAAKPIPLYLKAPKLYPLTELITDLDWRILNAQRICEPAYSAFAAMEITMALVADDASQLLSVTKSLLGELEFLPDISIRDSSSLTYECEATVRR